MIDDNLDAFDRFHGLLVLFNRRSKKLDVIKCKLSDVFFEIYFENLVLSRTWAPQMFIFKCLPTPINQSQTC